MGNELQFPDNFSQLMPNATLDSEVWGGIGQFQETTKLKSTAIKAFPVDIKFMVFDLVDPASQKLPYTERYQKLLSIIDPEHPFLVSFQKNLLDVFLDSNKLVPSQVLEENEQKRSEFEQMIVKGGGEGLILMESNSPYECGNTDKVLKLKPERDAEVLVISCDHKSLIVEMTNSTRFRILAPNQLERELPKSGDVVTITFKRYVNGSTLPHRPAIKCIRRDLTWDEVKALSNDHYAPRSRDDRDFSERWDIDIGGTRENLIQFAQKRGFDPFVADNWYEISGKEITAVKGAQHMLRAFCGSFIGALVTSFPELSFDKSKFLNIPRNHWTNAQNVKVWLDNFARTKGFNPRIAENWYDVTREDVCGAKGGYGMLKYHGRSHIKALKAAYPDIDLDRSKFTKAHYYYWKNSQNIKAWFDNFARTKGFDPLIAANWYNVTREDVCGEKGGYGMLKYYSKSHTKALKAVYTGIGLDESKFAKVPSEAVKAAYPDIGLDESKFSKVHNYHWKNTQKNIKAWFDDFARMKGFNPHIADNWYKFSLRDISGAKGGYGVLKYYGRSHIKALNAVYPDIGLDESKFSKVPQNHWKSVQNARAWLDEFANNKGFDPLVSENWKKVRHLHIHAVKGGRGLLCAFSASLKKLISAAYPLPR